MNEFMGILMKIVLGLKKINVFDESLVVQDQVKICDQEDSFELLYLNAVHRSLIPLFQVFGEQLECFVELLVEQLMEHQPGECLIKFDFGSRFNEILFAEVSEDNQSRLLNVV